MSGNGEWRTAPDNSLLFAVADLVDSLAHLIEAKATLDPKSELGLHADGVAIEVAKSIAALVRPQAVKA